MSLLSKVFGSITGANKIAQGQESSIQAQREMFGETKAALSPYIDFGKRGLEGLTSFMSDPRMIEQLPYYQFNLDQGLQSLQRGALAKGKFFSGQNVQDVLKFSQGLASQTYQDEFTRRFSLANVGLTAGEAPAGPAGAPGASLGETYLTAGMGRAQAQGALLSAALGAAGTYSGLKAGMPGK